MDKGESPAPVRRRGRLLAGLLIGLALGVVFGVIQGNLLEGAGFGLVSGLAIGLGLEGRGQWMQYQPGAMRRILLAAGLLLICLLLSFEYIDSVTPGILRIALALLPAAGFLLLVLALGQAIAGLDELQRRIQTEAIAIGFGLTAVVVLGVGLLGQAGVAQPNWTMAGLPMVIGWGIGKLWTTWKYR